MTLTIEFTAPFSFIPWVDTLWCTMDKDGCQDKVLSFGWGPLQVYLTNFSPIATGNRIHCICSTIVGDDKKMRELDNLASQEKFEPSEVTRLVRQIMIGGNHYGRK